MKTKFKLKYFLILSASLLGSVSFGHDVPVHRKITQNAAASALTYSSPYSDFFNTMSSDITYTDAVFFVVEGSALEDNIDIPGDVGGARSLNHFYDPINKRPLTDRGWPITPAQLGRDSFDWGSISNRAGFDVGWPISNEGTYNIWSWQNARYYEWLGLTATNQFDRQTNLANMFRAVGQVMHLLEDTSQPQHVRNEEHLDQKWKMDLYSRSAIEDYGLAHSNSLNYAHGMLNWRGAGFTQLKDFWDRDFLRTGGAAALNNDLSGGTTTLGLAEFTSGNFIGQRATYAEFFPDHSDIHYFAFPSLANTTQPNLRQGNLWGTAIHGDVTLENFKQGTRLYISKTGAGVPVTYHSALSYLIAQHPGKSAGLPILTIADNNVLSNYHNIFIPKAVQYSAGLLDYYFRGTMGVSVIGFNTNSLQYTNLIVNTSGQDFSGGTFSIYQDETNGIRTLLAETNFTGQTLASSNSMIMTFSASLLQTTNLLLVYQGAIGNDSSDAGIAIATTRFNTPPSTWTWQDIRSGSSQGSFTFSGNNFSVTASSPPTDEYGSYVGQILYNGTGSQFTITLNGSVSSTSYGSSEFYVAVKFAGGTPFSVFYYLPPSTLSNTKTNITIPSTGGLTKTIQVNVQWSASKVEGYAGDSGYVNVSGTLTNP